MSRCNVKPLYNLNEFSFRQEKWMMDTQSNVSRFFCLVKTQSLWSYWMKDAQEIMILVCNQVLPIQFGSNPFLKNVSSGFIRATSETTTNNWGLSSFLQLDVLSSWKNVWKQIHQAVRHIFTTQTNQCWRVHSRCKKTELELKGWEWTSQLKDAHWWVRSYAVT